MSEPAGPQPISPSRRKFLVVVDQTPECAVALRFASRRAQHTGGIVTLLYIVAPADFQQWAGVERLMREVYVIATFTEPHRPDERYAWKPLIPNSKFQISDSRFKSIRGHLRQRCDPPHCNF